MPGREIPLVNGEIYHVLNRGVASQPIFNNKKDYRRFLNLIVYYQNKRVSPRFSKFLSLSVERRAKILDELAKQRNLLIELLAYCLMPNHFHLLLRQAESEGISKFLGDITNSYTRYYNVKNKRLGPIVQGKFKAVRVETDEQLVHVVRYIHLNPYSSFIVKKLDEITSYPYSSLAQYLKLTKNQIVSKEEILSYFRTLKSFREFTFDQAGYQRDLQKLKHLTFEK